MRLLNSLCRCRISSFGFFWGLSTCLALIIPAWVGAQELIDPLAGAREPAAARIEGTADRVEANRNRGREDVQWALDQWNEEQFKEHPWFPMRDPVESIADWITDSVVVLSNPMDFFECMEPHVIQPWCEYCFPWLLPFYVDKDCDYPFYNLGVVFEYWWPEMEIEVNNFGISAINPVEMGRLEYAREVLVAGIENLYRNLDRRAYTLGILGNVEDNKDYKTKGYTHHAGVQPVDQTQVMEGHNYLTWLQDWDSKLRCQGCGLGDIHYVEIEIWGIEICIPTFLKFWYNGYMRGNHERCFYDALDADVGSQWVPKAWTEDSGMQRIPMARYWRIPENSKVIDPTDNDIMYRAGVPIRGNIPRPITVPIPELTANSNWTETCASYRMETWPDRYRILRNIGVRPYNRDLEAGFLRICYPGGGQLYPVTGKLLAQHHPLTSAAYLARRSIEVAGQGFHRHITDDPYHCVQKDHMNRFTRLSHPSPGGKELDKLQRVYPHPTKCFTMNQVEDYSSMFPPDGLRPDDNGSVRYVVWNKRQMCACEMRGSVSALERYNGPDWWSWFPWVRADFGWGCQPYPRDDGATGLDLGRGNLDEDDMPDDSIFDPLGYIVPLCYYPFVGNGHCKAGSGYIDEKLDLMDIQQCEDVP